MYAKVLLKSQLKLRVSVEYDHWVARLNYRVHLDQQNVENIDDVEKVENVENVENVKNVKNEMWNVENVEHDHWVSSLNYRVYLDEQISTKCKLEISINFDQLQFQKS